MILGIDVSKDKLDVVLLPANQHKVIENKNRSIELFFKQQLKGEEEISIVVFEATGGYEKRLMMVLVALAIPFHRAHPNRVYHFGKSKGYFAKNDRIDAGLLARYGQQEGLTESQLRGRCKPKLN